jgi:predicted neutral ceramidase superfamily lipid hydrolase
VSGLKRYARKPSSDHIIPLKQEHTKVMAPFPLFLAIMIILYAGLAVFGGFRKRLKSALAWVGVSIVVLISVFSVCYIAQDILPRLYELSRLLSGFFSFAALIFGFYKVGNPTKKIQDA